MRGNNFCSAQEKEIIELVTMSFKQPILFISIIAGCKVSHKTSSSVSRVICLDADECLCVAAEIFTLEHLERSLTRCTATLPLNQPTVGRASFFFSLPCRAKIISIPAENKQTSSPSLPKITNGERMTPAGSALSLRLVYARVAIYM
jgi:hypothetical protein